MNKKILTAGAASAVLAAVPVVGVFAADVGSATDTINITIESACTLGESVTAKTIDKTIANGAHEDALEGNAFTISCNDANGWELSAVGAGNEGHLTDLTMADSSQTIPSTGAITIDGSTSAWGFKLTGTHVKEGYQGTEPAWAAIPGTTTVVAEDTSPAAAESISVTYGVSISSTQPAGVYSGKVTYTLAAKAAPSS